MELISGKKLNPAQHFMRTIPKAQGSSVNLTIGKIFDENGCELQQYLLKPGHMVQVISAEYFNLNNSTTGHVTYKTSLTQKGIWALTVGIVDPGWDAPISTTLLNFSRVDHLVNLGEEFLRVSLYRHNPVDNSAIRKSPENYERQIRTLAATTFPPTFLNSAEIQKSAGDYVMKKIRKEALAWIAGIVVVLTLAQLFVAIVAPHYDLKSDKSEEIAVSVRQLQTELLAVRQNEIWPLKLEIDQLKTKSIGNRVPQPQTDRASISVGKQ